MHIRIEREMRVVDRMIQKFCQDNHDRSTLCMSCNELKEYTFKKLIACPFAHDKPACSNCKIHCYNKNQREKIKEVMRYSGPKMLIQYPGDTILFFLNKIKYKNQSVHDNSKF